MRNIKKFMAVTAASVMALSLAGCGTSSDSSSSALSNAGSNETEYTIGICQLVQHAALDAATEGFKAALTEKLGDSVKFEEQNAQGDSPTCSTIINQFVSSNVDLILANATAPLQSAASATIDIPILGTSVTDYATALDEDDWSGTTGRNISGTSDFAPLEEQAAMLKELFPDAKEVGLLYCSAEANSKYQVDIIKEELEGMGYTCEYYSFVDSNDISAVATNAVAKSDVLYIPTDNTAASCTGIIDGIARPAGIPIIAGEEGICGGCGVATLSIDYYELGYATGEMAYEILVNGEDITKMEVRYSPTVTKKYNKDICSDLGIKVPDDYEAIETEE